MERISLKQDRKAIIMEHVHRYELCSQIVHGNVLDISCGIGYGSEILCKNPKVSSYTGVDISEEDIGHAKANFATSKTEFLTGDITKLNFGDSEFDSVTCLETLEHIDNPTQAIAELKRVIKKDGVLVGTVPEDTYDQKCEEVYGENPYHLVRFSEGTLSDYLKKEFSNVLILKTGVVFGTLVSGNATKLEQHPLLPHGSLLFIASNNLDTSRLGEQISGVFKPALSMPEYDEENSTKLWHTINSQLGEINALKEALGSTEQSILEKNDLISKQDSLVSDKSRCIEAMEANIQDKEKSIKAMETLIKDRDECIKSMESMIQARDESIKSMEIIIEKRWQIIQDYEKALNELREGRGG